jgi:hypothetical protein
MAEINRMNPHSQGHPEHWIYKHLQAIEKALLAITLTLQDQVSRGAAPIEQSQEPYDRLREGEEALNGVLYPKL